MPEIPVLYLLQKCKMAFISYTDLFFYIYIVSAFPIKLNIDKEMSC